MSLEKQLADYGRLHEQVFGPIGADEVTNPVVQKRVRGDLATQGPSVARQPRRNRGPAWALVTFAVVITAGGLFLAFSGDDGEVVDNQTVVPSPTTVPTSLPSPTPLTQEDYEPIGPGYYFLDADERPSTPAGATVIIEDNRWIGWTRGLNFNGGNGVTLHLHVFVEPFIPGCGLDWGAPLPSGSTAADLAAEIAASGFTVLEKPKPVSAFGRDGYHVVVELPEGCQFGGDPGFTGNYGPLAHISVSDGAVIEAWSFDIDGSIAMIEAIWFEGYAGNLTEAGQEDLAEVRAVIDSLVLTP